MTLDQILSHLPSELQASLSEPPSNGSSAARTLELQKSVLVENLQVLDPLCGGREWRAPVEQLALHLTPFALRRLTLFAQSDTLVSVQSEMNSTRPLELPGIGNYPSLEVGWTIRFPQIPEKRRSLASAGGKLHVGEFVFDAPFDFAVSRIMASAEHRTVDFTRFRELPLMARLTQTQAARPNVRFTDVFVEILWKPKPGGLEFIIDTVAATNAKGAEETWRRQPESTP